MYPHVSRPYLQPQLVALVWGSPPVVWLLLINQGTIHVYKAAGEWGYGSVLYLFMKVPCLDQGLKALRRGKTGVREG